MLEFRRPVSQEELEAIFRLRYEVYCHEKGFLQPGDYPNGLETDELDEHSVHFLAMNTDDGGELLGCFRLILPSHHGFPCENHFELTEKAPDPSRTVEMSRMMVAPAARGMWRHVLMGLSKEVYLYNRENGVTHNYAVLDEGLFTVLHRVGLPFRPIGPHADYMGDTLPTILSMEVLEEILPHRNAWFYDYLQAPREGQGVWF